MDRFESAGEGGGTPFEDPPRGGGRLGPRDSFRAACSRAAAATPSPGGVCGFHFGRRKAGSPGIPAESVTAGVSGAGIPCPANPTIS